jgi:hypothetical protein
MTHGGRRNGAGRKRVAPNKTTAEVRELARASADRVLDKIEELAFGVETSDSIRLAALKELLYAAIGKPWQAPRPSPPVGPQEPYEPEEIVWATNREDAIPDPAWENMDRAEREANARRVRESGNLPE